MRCRFAAIATIWLAFGPARAVSFKSAPSMSVSVSVRSPTMGLRSMDVLPGKAVKPDVRALMAMVPMPMALIQGTAPLPQRRDHRGAAESDERSLLNIFDGTIMRRVFDAGTGTGVWLDLAAQQPWIKPGGKIQGFDLPNPMKYDGKRGFPMKRWKGRPIITSTSDRRYPRPESVDLVHLSFMEMHFPRWRNDLKRYQALVRSGGYFLVAHSNRYAHIDAAKSGSRVSSETHFRERFPAKEWTVLARYAGEDRPRDYPTTHWWRFFLEQGQNFLLVFQKK